MKKIVSIEGSDNDVTAIMAALAFMNHLIKVKDARLVTLAVDGIVNSSLILKDEDGVLIESDPLKIPLQPTSKDGYTAHPVGQIDGKGNLTVDVLG